MDLLIKIVEIVALIIQFIGVVMMYRNSKLHDASWDPTMDDAFMFQTKSRSKNKRLRAGFLVLAIGISLSFLSLFLKDIVPLIYTFLVDKNTN